MVHATDFDDQSTPESKVLHGARCATACQQTRYGHEKVEWIVVNGKEAAL